MTILNNHCARNGLKLEVKADSVGPPHSPSWSAQCTVDGKVYGTVSSMHKSKEAKEEAARLTLDMLQAGEGPAKERYLPIFNDHLRANEMTHVFADRRYEKGGSDHQPIWVARFCGKY
ncbi:hypothetical protein SCHPADRAFT_195147 [Schizopora paradoxa]|uniref:DRBM domain-containing protein n=1 Tax=Schizopora paradoxa TaxID=27342 RepID=A0A0H2S586_9AGAM|nr:hypothetical protein SCHPADRAFT_195147 [Schizopora paradoxa]